MLIPAPPVECLSLLDGQRRLEAIRTGVTTYAGAHLMRVTADPEAGDYDDPEVLGQAGTVPDLEN